MKYRASKPINKDKLVLLSMIAYLVASLLGAWALSPVAINTYSDFSKHVYLPGFMWWAFSMIFFLIASFIYIDVFKEY